MRLQSVIVQDSQRRFMVAVKKIDIDKVTKWTNRGLDPNFIDLDSAGGPFHPCYLSFSISCAFQKFASLVVDACKL